MAENERLAVGGEQVSRGSTNADRTHFGEQPTVGFRWELLRAIAPMDQGTMQSFFGQNCAYATSLTILDRTGDAP